MIFWFNVSYSNVSRIGIFICIYHILHFFQKTKPDMSGRGPGRPVGSIGSKKVEKGTSRLETKCAVCSLVQRADNIKSHQVSVVLFDDDGKPADNTHPRYISLSKSEKEHTDYFRNNGFSRVKFPANKIVIKETAGSITSFFAKQPKLGDINQNPSGSRDETPANDKEL